MSGKKVLVASDAKFSGDLGAFVGRHGYTQFYGPISSAEVTKSLIDKLPDVDIFWVQTSDLGAPTTLTEFKAPEYGDRKMWIITPEPSSPRESKTSGKRSPDVIEEFGRLNLDPNLIAQLIQSYTDIMSGPSFLDWMDEERERIREEKGFSPEDLDDPRLEREVEDELARRDYPEVSLFSLGEFYTLDAIKQILNHLHPFRTDFFGEAALEGNRAPGTLQPFYDEDEYEVDRESDMHTEHARQLLLGAVSATELDAEKIEYLFRLTLEADAIATLLQWGSLGNGDALTLAEKLLQISSADGESFAVSDDPNGISRIFQIALGADDPDERMLRWAAEMGWRPTREHINMSDESWNLLQRYISEAGTPRLGREIPTHDAR